MPTVLVSLHSFTPVYAGVARPWHIGTLYQPRHRACRRACCVTLLRAGADLVVGDNEPYAVSDETDYTIPVHGEARGLMNTEIEIRQDLIGDVAGEKAWADRLARILWRDRSGVARTAVGLAAIASTVCAAATVRRVGKGTLAPCPPSKAFRSRWWARFALPTLRSCLCGVLTYFAGDPSRAPPRNTPRPRSPRLPAITPTRTPRAAPAWPATDYRG